MKANFPDKETSSMHNRRDFKTHEAMVPASYRCRRPVIACARLQDGESQTTMDGLQVQGGRRGTRTPVDLLAASTSKGGYQSY